MQTYRVELKKNEVFCREGDLENDLYIVQSGELLVCMRKNSQVTAIATLGAGEFIGELSFFDNQPRGSDIIALSACELVRIAAVDIRQALPWWLHHLGKSLAFKLRLYDDIIRQKGIKKTNVQTIKPLTIDEQRFFYQLLSK